MRNPAALAVSFPAVIPEDRNRESSGVGRVFPCRHSALDAESSDVAPSVIPEDRNRESSGVDVIFVFQFLPFSVILKQ